MKPRTDIAVVGAGAAGIAAAVNAGRAGCSVLLLDARPAAGGTGGFSGLTTLCGLFDDQGEFLDGFSEEFARAVTDAAPLRQGRVWTLPYLPEKFRAAAAMFLAEANVQTHWNAPLESLEMDGRRVASVNGIRVGAVIDCSGTAVVAEAAGTPCLATDETTQAPAVVFSLRRVSRPFATPVDAARILLPLARAGFPPASMMPGLVPQCVTVKFTGEPGQVADWISFVQANIDGFQNCEPVEKTFTVSKRAGRMIIGQYVLTGTDVLAAQKFKDAAARCAWPIEQWNAAGVARYRYLPPGEYYEIPERSLRCAGVENLFMAGKTCSADADAIASARVMGCCLATGAAAGALAARCARLHETQLMAQNS